MKKEYNNINEIQQQAVDNIRQAYDKGYKAGYIDGKIKAYKNPVPIQNAYNDGLRDTWEYAKKIVKADYCDQNMVEIFGDDFYYGSKVDIFEKYSASEAIAKIKEYEDSQKCKKCKHEHEDICNGCVDLSEFEEKQSRVNCIHRHENGNCLKIGGFCLAVDDKYCDYEEKQKQTQKSYENCGQKCAIKYHGCSNWKPKQTNDEIKIGDKIYSKMTNTTGVVVNIDSWNRWNCLFLNGISNIDEEQKKYWVKTGHIFPQIVEILEQMKEDVE